MKKVIWAILLTNMDHITDQYGPYWEPPSNGVIDEVASLVEE